MLEITDVISHNHYPLGSPSPSVDRGRSGDRHKCKAAVATSGTYAVGEAGIECSCTIELGHQTHCRSSGVDVKSMGTLYILKDDKELGR